MIESLLSLTFSNALAALVLALAAIVVTRFVRTPALAYALWIVVLLKLISPAFVELPVRLPSWRTLLAPQNLQKEAHEEIGQLNSSHSRLGEPRPSGRVSPIEDSPRRRIETAGPEESGESKSLFSETQIDFSAAAASSSNQIVDETPTALYSKFSLRWQDLIFAVWLGGTAVWFCITAMRVTRFRKWLSKAQPADAALRRELAEIAREIGMRHSPELRAVDATCPPLTWAIWGRPVVLLPKTLMENLSSNERRAVLLHEVAHLRRRDHWVRWLELVVTGLQWWQPLAWFARRELHLASEECCDAWVVHRFPELARIYAATLLKTVDFLAEAHTPLPIGATGFGEARQLKRRLEMILKEGLADRLSSKRWIGLAMIALVVMPFSVRALWAEPEKRVGPFATFAAVEAGSADESEPQDAIAIPPANLEEHSKADKSTTNLDERMRRLEATVEKLARIVEASQAKNSDLHIPDSSSLTAPRGETNKPTGIPSNPANSAAKPADPNAENPSPVPDVLLQELNNPANGRRWSQVIRDADTKLVLYKTNFNRLVAAKKQCEAVKEAYDAGTVSFDLLLESQRTKVDADLACVNSIFDLAPQSSDLKQRHLILEKVRVYREARDLALQTWKEVHAKFIDGTKGGEADREAQAREQYFACRAALESAIADLTK